MSLSGTVSLCVHMTGSESVSASIFSHEGERTLCVAMYSNEFGMVDLYGPCDRLIAWLQEAVRKATEADMRADKQLGMNLADQESIGGTAA